MRERLSKITASLLGYWKRSAERERVLIGVSIVAIAVAAVYQVAAWGGQVFAAQQERLSEAQKDADRAAQLLQSYLKLSAHKQQLEKQFEQVENREGGLGYLENLVRNEAGVTEGFAIKDSPVKAFGGNYEQAPFNISFSITSLEKLVAFLKALVHGSQPFILSKLDIQKSRRAERLEVDLEVSSIRRVSTQ